MSFLSCHEASGHRGNLLDPPGVEEGMGCESGLRSVLSLLTPTDLNPFHLLSRD